jgi:hypothetical protein
LAALAEQFGIRIPSLYNHVAGIEGLRRGVTLASLRHALAAFRDAVIGKAGDDAVFALAQVYREFALRYPGQYAAIMTAPHYQDAEMVAEADATVALVVAVLAAYQLRDADAYHAVRALRSLAHGFVSLEASGNFGMPLGLDESYRRLVAGYVRGLRFPPTSDNQ